MDKSLEAVVTAELAALGLELVEMRRGGSSGRPVLDIRVDRMDQAKVQVGDCVRASRAIEARLDADPSIVSARYVLEVSSPGMERPLRSVADWRRFTGKKANVNAMVLHGRQEVVIVAVNGEPGQEQVLLRDMKGIEHAIALTDVTDARLAFHWEP